MDRIVGEKGTGTSRTQSQSPSCASVALRWGSAVGQDRAELGEKVVGGERVRRGIRGKDEG